jgi:large subunit ribosomal protein LX
VVKTYRVTGTFKAGAQQARFATQFEVDSPERARERAYSDFGSRHHVNRRQITIDKVEEVKAEGAGRKAKGA